MEHPASPLRDILHIGRILGAHGLQGELKILPLTDNSKRFQDLTDCLVVSNDEREHTPAQVAGVRLLNDQVLLRLKGISDRTAAELLKGKFISVTREHAVALPPDTWFICDLIGCDVYDHEHGYLGQVRDIQSSSAQDVYIVEKKGQKDLLFPALKSILCKVDLEARRIDVTLPSGLFEIYRDI